MNNIRSVTFFFVIYLLLSILNISPVIGISSKGLALVINYFGFGCLITAFLLSKPFSPSNFSRFLFKRCSALPVFVILFYLTGSLVAIWYSNYEPLILILPLMIRCSLSVFMISWLFCYVLTQNKYNQYMKIFAVILLIAAGSILLLNFMGIELSYLVDTTLGTGDDIIGRSSGFFINANIAAQHAIFALIFLLYFIEAGKLKFYFKIFLLILILVCVFAVILTFSSTGFVNLLLVFLYFIFNKYRNKVKFAFHFMLIFILFQSVVLSMQSYSNEYYNAFNIPQIQQEKISNFLNLISFYKTGNVDYSSRGDLVEIGIAKVVLQPFFGYGAGSFNGGLLGKLGVHNTYLQIIGETGFFIFIIYIVLIFRILKRCFRIKNKAANFLLTASFLTIIVLQTTTHGILYSEAMLLMMILINCISININYFERFKSNRPESLKSLN